MSEFHPERAAEASLTLSGGTTLSAGEHGTDGLDLREVEGAWVFGKVTFGGSPDGDTVLTLQRSTADSEADFETEIKVIGVIPLEISATNSVCAWVRGGSWVQLGLRNDDTTDDVTSAEITYGTVTGWGDT